MVKKPVNPDVAIAAMLAREQTQLLGRNVPAAGDLPANLAAQLVKAARAAVAPIQPPIRGTK